MTRKEGGKFGFAESIPNQKITAFKMESTAVDTDKVEEQAEEIIAKAEPPLEVYPFYGTTQGKTGFSPPALAWLETKHTSKVPHSLGSLTAFRGNSDIILGLVLTAFG